MDMVPACADSQIAMPEAPVLILLALSPGEDRFRLKEFV
jgi:hypothetical protein